MADDCPLGYLGRGPEGLLAAYKPELGEGGGGRIRFEAVLGKTRRTEF
jgi:hypothetical protein